MNPDVCICGHHRDTHFLDNERPGEYQPGEAPKTFRGSCLGMHCDHCSKFNAKHPKD